MDSFTYSYSTKVYFGENCAKCALDGELGKYGNNMMLCYGSGSVKENGIYDEINSILKRNGKRVFDFSGITPNPTYRKALEGARIARENNIDLIIALGGGSVIDCSKVIAVAALLDEDIYEMEYEKRIFPKRSIPLGAIVTASGTGAEMNSGAVITYEEKKWKGAIWASSPRFAILDPRYTMTVPRRQVISGAFDTLSHAMETYLGSSDRDNVSDDLALATMANTVRNIRRILLDINDIEARSNLMWDSAIAENGILKCGRYTDFQAHQIEHQLGAYTDCNHGEGLAVIQPKYYSHILDAAREKLERFSSVVFGKKSAEEGLDALSSFIKECGLPSRLRDLKSKCEITPDLLRAVAYSTNIIRTSPRPLTHDEIYGILLECM